MPVEADTFRQVMGRFATGVTIVTTRSGDDVHGLTVNAFTSVSLDPPLVLVCIDRFGTSISYMARAENFAVNLLTREQEGLATRFADSSLTSAERFQGVRYDTAVTGAPVLEGTLGYLDCRITQQYEAGDHTIFLGEVVDAATGVDAPPLVFYRSRYRDLK